MTRPADCEVVVVGGGPAGSVTATLLAGSGHDVLLLDRAAFPRGKPCGESINPGAIRELAELGLLDLVLQLAHQRITRWRIHPTRGLPFEGHFPTGEFGVAIDRSLLDAALVANAQAAGVAVETGAHVTDLLFVAGAVAGVRTADGREFRARLVIGADGLRSVVVRRLGLLRRRPLLRKIALTAHVEGADLPPSTGLLAVRPWGVLGIAAVSPGSANVALVMDQRESVRVRGDVTAHFDRLVATVANLRTVRRVSGVRATGPFDWPTRRVTADGALLVGDAAGYFDPFTGQGIFRALRGARLAARVASECLRRRRCSRAELAAYERQHRAAFNPGVRVQRVIELGLAHPWLFEAAAATLRYRPSLAHRLVGITGDLRPVRSFLLPTRTPGGARGASPAPLAGRSGQRPAPTANRL